MKRPDEANSSSDGRERSSPKDNQPLQMRLYFRRHMTELVRLFGYAGLPVDEAKARLVPLRAEYGDEKIATACEELLDIDQSRLPHWVSLKSNVRKLARALLGPPTENIPVRAGTHSPGLDAMTMKRLTETAPPSEQPPGQACGSEPTVTERKIAIPAAVLLHFKADDGGHAPLDAPRPAIRKQFSDWLSDTELPAYLGDELRYEYPDLERGQHVLDAVLYDDDQPAVLIALRKTLGHLELRTLATWRQAIGVRCRAWRVWPAVESDATIWCYEDVTAQVTEEQQTGTPAMLEMSAPQQPRKRSRRPSPRGR